MGADVGQWGQQVNGKMQWEDGDLSEKLEGVGLEEHSGLAKTIKIYNLKWFGVTGWSRSVDIAYKDKGEHFIKAAPIAVVAGVVDFTGGNANCPGLFVKVLRYRQRFSEFVSE